MIAAYPNSTIDDLEFDQKHIWHPYTSMRNPLEVFPITKADKHRLVLANGHELIDGMASWWCAIHGYNVPELNQAIQQQLENMAHVMFGGITHPAAIKLARQLIEITPQPLEKIFFADSGSVSVEVAIKMALQYWHALQQTNKKTLLTVRGGYHGDTIGAMSVCDPVTGMHEKFTNMLPDQLFANKPAPSFQQTYTDQHISDFKQQLDKHHASIAAVILEPIVQGAGGMYFYSPSYLKTVRELCNEYNVLLICDEIATGFGRTGKLFAVEHADICPDILCLGKALTGGYMTLAATLTTEKVANGIAADGDGTLMHGPTFMANPLACAVASASINLLLSNPWQQQISDIETTLKHLLAPCSQLDIVEEVRVLGAIGVVELKRPVNMPIIMKRWVEAGVWIRPFGKLVYIMPAFNMPLSDIERLANTITEVLTEDGLSLLAQPT